MANNVIGSKGIAPVQRPTTQETTKTTRRDGATSIEGFSPRTELAIGTSVNSMSGILAKISAENLHLKDEIPDELQKLIDEALTSTFKLSETLSKGVGSTLESSRFSLEQLTILNRLVEKLAIFSTKGMTGQMSDEVGTILQNAKGLLQSEGMPASALLNKIAFDSLDGSTSEQLPKEVQQILSLLNALGTTGSQGATQPANSEGFSLLKQLVDAFFPKHLFKGAESEQPAGQQTGTQGQPAGQQVAGQPQTAQQAAQGQQAGQQQAGTQGQGTPQGQPTAQGQAAPQGQVAAQGQPAMQGQAAGQQGVMQQQVAQQNQASGQLTTTQQDVLAEMQENTAPKPARNFAKLNNYANEQEQAALNKDPLLNTKKMMENENPLFKNIFSRQGAIRDAQARTTQQAPQGGFQNTPETMKTMQKMADFFLQNEEISPKEQELLQNFVNAKQGHLTKQDAKQLDVLLRLIQSNVPAALQKAGQQQGMQDLPRLWAFVELTNLATIKHMKAQDLRNASRKLEKFVGSMKSSLESSGAFNTIKETGETPQKALNFMLPLYFADGEKSYPAYVHVYNDDKATSPDGTVQKETWLRVCVLTDNIGAVEMTSLLYDGKNLSLRVMFSDESVIPDFKEYVPELRAFFKQSDLVLNDLKISTILGVNKNEEVEDIEV